IPLEPPARILSPEYDHEQRRDEKQTTRTRDERCLRTTTGLQHPTTDTTEHNEYRQNQNQPERGPDTVEFPVRVLDVEVDWIGGPSRTSCRVRGILSHRYAPQLCLSAALPETSR